MRGRRAHRDIVRVPAAADSAGHALQREASALQPCNCVGNFGTDKQLCVYTCPYVNSCHLRACTVRGVQGRIPSMLQNSKATALTSARTASAAAQGCSCARSTGRSPCSSLQSYTSWQVGTQGSEWLAVAQKHNSNQRALACNTVDEGMLTRTRKGSASAGSSARTAASGTGSLLLSRHALMPGRDMSLRECDIDVPV